MSDKSNQQISNLMDGELEINASKFLLKRMASDDSLSKTWENYHLIKSCLQKQDSEPLIDVSKRVAQQLKNEGDGYSKQIIQEKKPLMHRWLKPVIGLGIAASVAFMSVTMLQNQQINGVNATPVVENTLAQIDYTSTSPILQTNINATTASSGTTLMPPPSLSRFPSASQQQNSFNQTHYFNNKTPYIIVINNSANSTNNQLSPIRGSINKQEISD